MMPTDRAGFKDANSLAKSKLRGQVRFSPHEHLDEVALQEIRRHRVTPFGNIHETCLHIPYNSGKKDFFEKTGRESFEVFKYEFVSLENGTEYAVMWDYNIGLVRMTPFFKCRGYGKTIPAKMLGLNPGLKEITHSITGGSIAAQGMLQRQRLLGFFSDLSTQAIGCRTDVPKLSVQHSVIPSRVL
ncbi:hypothetical protein ACHAPD_004987 [Fusarium lateritium]